MPDALKADFQMPMKTYLRIPHLSWHLEEEAFVVGTGEDVWTA